METREPFATLEGAGNPNPQTKPQSRELINEEEHLVTKLWIGVDVGKTHHHVAAVDGDGRLVYSRRVANDETAVLTVMAEISAVGRPVCWAVDVTTSLSALLLTLLWR
jgi:predicted RNase H-like nuclease (RuvC/YqgF family)